MMQTMPCKVSQNTPQWRSLEKFVEENLAEKEEELLVFTAEINSNNYNYSNYSNSIIGKSGKKEKINYISRATSCSVESESEPTSALDNISIRRSPSPPKSSSTLSGVADPAFDTEIRHIGSGGGVGAGGSGGAIGLEEWDSLFPNGDGALLPWIMGDSDDSGLGLGLKHLLQSGNNSNAVVEFEGNAGLGVVDQTQQQDQLIGGDSGSISPNCGQMNGFNLNPNQLLGGGMQFPLPLNAVGNDKERILNQQLVMNQQQAHIVATPSFLMSPSATLGNYCQQFEQFQPQAKRHNPGVVLDPNLKNPFIDPAHHEMFLRKQLQQSQMGFQPLLVPNHIQQNNQFQMQEQGVKDLLFKAGDLIQTGNFSLAQEILARLNQQLSLPAKPPIIRAALYVKEALQMLLQLSNPVTAPPPKSLTPYDIVYKMNAYKVFSEVSPITQFVNFTCTQAILEALDDADAIHIIDFDIGCGAQWASLIQELPLRKRGAPSLHITAVIPPTTLSFELALIRENLAQFASDTNIAFKLQVLSLDSFDPSLSSFPDFRTSEDECVAVSIPIWASSTRPSLLPSILRFAKQLSPKVVVSLDKGFDRYDVPFPQHLIHSLESCTNFLESLDGLNVAVDIVSKVEKFFVQPMIENSVLGRLHAPDKMPHWKNLFASAGLIPLQFSNFTETQADYVVKRTPGRGFHVEKRQASLVLSWQRRELVAASAWRC